MEAHGLTGAEARLWWQQSVWPRLEGYPGRDSNDRLASVLATAPPSPGISGTLWWLKRPDSPIRPLGPDLLLSLTQEGGGQTLCSVSTYSLVPAALLAACPTLDASRSPYLRLSLIAVQPCEASLTRNSVSTDDGRGRNKPQS